MLPLLGSGHLPQASRLTHSLSHPGWYIHTTVVLMDILQARLHYALVSILGLDTAAQPSRSYALLCHISSRSSDIQSWAKTNLPRIFYDHHLVTLHYAFSVINAYLSHLPSHLAAVNLLYRGYTCRILVLELMWTHVLPFDWQTSVAATTDRLRLLPLPTDLGCCHSRQTYALAHYGHMHFHSCGLDNINRCSRPDRFAIWHISSVVDYSQCEGSSKSLMTVLQYHCRIRSWVLKSTRDLWSKSMAPLQHTCNFTLLSPIFTWYVEDEIVWSHT